MGRICSKENLILPIFIVQMQVVAFVMPVYLLSMLLPKCFMKNILSKLFSHHKCYMYALHPVRNAISSSVISNHTSNQAWHSWLSSLSFSRTSRIIKHRHYDMQPRISVVPCSREFIYHFELNISTSLSVFGLREELFHGIIYSNFAIKYYKRTFADFQMQSLY